MPLVTHFFRQLTEGASPTSLEPAWDEIVRLHLRADLSSLNPRSRVRQMGLSHE